MGGLGFNGLGWIWVIHILLNGPKWTIGFLSTQPIFYPPKLTHLTLLISRPGEHRKFDALLYNNSWLQLGFWRAQKQAIYNSKKWSPRKLLISITQQVNAGNPSLIVSSSLSSLWSKLGHLLLVRSAGSKVTRDCTHSCFQNHPIW